MAQDLSEGGGGGVNNVGEEEKLDFVRRPRTRFSGLRYIINDKSEDELTWAEEVLKCMRSLPQLSSFAESMEKKHDELINALSEEEGSVQPCVKLVLDDEKVIKAMFDTKHRYDQIEFIFNGIYSLLPYVENDEFSYDIKRISTILSSQGNEFTALNIKLFSLLFNLIPKNDLQTRAMILEQTLGLVARSNNSKLAEQWQTRLKQFLQWLKDWKLTKKQRKNIYFIGSQIATLANNESLQQEYLLEYLKTWEDDEKVNDVAIEHATQAVIGAVKNDTINTRRIKELNNCNVIKAMKNESPKYDDLCELVQIVYNGSVSDCSKFIEANGKYIDSIGIDGKNLLHKMRLLSLCSLGHNGKSISFGKLKNELMIESDNEIETIVIDAIKRQLIEAKIDHLSQQVVINRAKLRTFEKESWDEIEKKLALWKHNTSHVLRVISNAGFTEVMQGIAQN